MLLQNKATKLKVLKLKLQAERISPSLLVSLKEESAGSLSLASFRFDK